MLIPTDILKDGAHNLGLDLSGYQLEQFDTFASLLIEWNRRFNLTRITEPREIVTKHFLDSLICLKAAQFPSRARVIDVGTGPGMPGIPVKILRPDILLVLMDSVRKKLVFVEEVLRRLGIKDAEVLHARAEDAGHEQGQRAGYDVVLARALAKLPEVVEICVPLAKVKGIVLVMKGPEVSEEIASAQHALDLLGAQIERVVELKVPHTLLLRNILVIKKIRSTSSRYPRSPADIARSPL